MRRRLITGLVVIAVIGALVGTELLSGSSGGQTGRRAPPLPTSVLVPPKVSLDSLRGQPAAINFWASWCHPCRKEAPALQRLARSLDGRAQLIGVNWTDGLSEARAWVDKYGWTFPNLRDPNGAAGNEYRLHGLPMTFILDSRGSIADVLYGPQSESSVRQALGSAG
jgi:cytochrome c biogenesis protein CcmG, thiol:disulfide interchange protein DsbE